MIIILFFVISDLRSYREWFKSGALPPHMVVPGWDLNQTLWMCSWEITNVHMFLRRKSKFYALFMNPEVGLSKTILVQVYSQIYKHFKMETHCCKTLNLFTAEVGGCLSLWNISLIDILNVRIYFKCCDKGITTIQSVILPTFWGSVVDLNCYNCN